MKVKYIRLLIFPVIALLIGCGGGLESKALTPEQVDESMVDQVVRVAARIELVVENPGGLGGMYLVLEGGQIAVRLQDDVWTSMNENEKDLFKEGKTLTAEGVLFMAGKQMVIIYAETPANQP